MKIGLIGTGLLGFPMSEKLLEKYGEISVYNRTREKTEKLSEKGAYVCNSTEELILRSDVIITMLTTYEANLEVLEPATNDFTSKTVIQMGTIKVEESIDLKEKIENAGGQYIEAPVLGSIPNIKNNTLITFFGGRKEQFEKFQSLFQTFGKKVEYFGEVGKASAVKLAFNQLIASLTATFSMSLGFILENDINVEHFMNVLRESALYAPTFDKKLKRMLERDFENPNFPVKHLLKDVHLIYDDFASRNINVDLLDALKYILRESLRLGDAEADYSAIYNAIHKRNFD